MRAILSSFELDSQRRTLVRELDGVDDRQLLDMGLVRGADGALHSAADPAQAIGRALPRRRVEALLEGLAGLWSWLRSLQFRNPDWRAHFFLRE